MTTSRPSLAPEDDLTAAADVDYKALLAPLLEQRYRSPIIRASRATDVSALIDESFPRDGEALTQLVAQITAAAERYPRRNTHPGFFGWIAPSGLPSDPLAHAIVTVMNENVGGYWASPVGTTIERTVIRWLTELVDFPPQAEGVFLSGGSVANMTAIASALAHKFGPEYRQRGIAAFSNPDRPVIICSQEAHFSIRRGAAMLGIGVDNIVCIDTDAEFRMRSDRLAEAVELQDNIVCVVATAGTTTTGAIDPLDAIADICAQQDIWLHVDAAYGGGGLLAEELKPRYRGIERADSVIMDMHKWFFQSLDGSLVLFRDAQAARSLFFESADYLRVGEDTSPEQYGFFHIAPELSRRFRALPFYIALRCYGIDRLGRNALHNVQCAEYLAELIEQHAELELVAAPQLSILCFRFAPVGISAEGSDEINREIRDRIQTEGDYLMSPTEVQGRPVLRLCIINHATRAEHIEGLLARVLNIGHSLVA